MAWTFRKRKKLFPGVRLNYGSSGLSLNIGRPGASVTVGADGVYANLGIPGTGIRNRQKITSSTALTETNDSPVTEKDIKRAGCFRDAIYFFCYSLSYSIIITLWIITGISYSKENYIYLIPAIIDGLFIINTFRLHLYHRRANITSTYTFPIILTIVIMTFCSFAGINLYLQNETIAWTLCVMLDVLLGFNLFCCFKYRVKKSNVSSQISVTPTFHNTPHTISNSSVANSHNSTNIPTQKTSNTPSIDYTKESLLYFSQNRVRAELERYYSKETINVCEYIVNAEKCVLSDIQAELGISYQKVVEAVKILEKTRIVKSDGSRRKVIVIDETVAIRLLLRYAKEHS